jgi:antitoxin component of RelBE/YafQ-DinJ toxin-antitoxin module
MRKRTISLSVDDKVYQTYMTLCKEQGIVMSKQVENFMREIISRLKK